MDVRRMVGGVGRTMITAGALILLFVAYQLWGTALAESRHQRRLTEQFESSLAAPTGPAPAPSPVTPGATSPTSPAPTDTAPPAPPAPVGAAVAILEIPKLGVEKVVVEGVTVNLLKKGPGHFPDTPLPGQPGNAAIAGHRTTYGAPFYRLDELSAGDAVLVTTRQGRFRYEVSEKRVVAPDETSVLAPAGDNRLTLSTCNPRFSAAQRLIVVATLVGQATAPPPAAPVEPGPTPPPSTAPVPVPAPSLEQAEEDLSGGNASNGPAVAWGLAAAGVWLLSWLAARRWRKWPSYAMGLPVFLTALFMFFENFSRLLPSNF